VRAGDRPVSDGDDDAAEVRRCGLDAAHIALPFRPISMNHDSIGTDSESAL
jgi:hypothetical protein